MALLAIALGSNLGNRSDFLCRALAALEEEVGALGAISPFVESEAEGFESEHTFLNAAALIQTIHSPEELLERTQRIEQRLGRTKKSTPSTGYSDRTIDIDLLLLEDCIMHTDRLTLPHPLMHLRSFVLAPLCCIAPTMEHPILKKSIQVILENERH